MCHAQRRDHPCRTLRFGPIAYPILERSDHAKLGHAGDGNGPGKRLRPNSELDIVLVKDAKLGRETGAGVGNREIELRTRHHGRSQTSNPRIVEIECGKYANAQLDRVVVVEGIAMIGTRAHPKRFRLRDFGDGPLEGSTLRHRRDPGNRVSVDIGNQNFDVA